MNKRSLWMFVTIILAVLATGTYWIVFRRPIHNNLGTKRIVVAQYGNFFLYAPLYLAQDAGFFAKNGLEVSVTSTGGDEKTWAAVMSGDAAFGIADPTFVAISDARGRSGVVVANIVNGVPFWGIALDSSISPIKDPRGLDSHTVATFPAPSTAYTLQEQMFKDAGLTHKIRQGDFGGL